MTTERMLGGFTRTEWLVFLGIATADDPKLAALAATSWGGNALKVLQVNATENGWQFAAVTSFTDEAAQDAVGTILADSATIDFTYADGTPSITADVKTDSIDNTLLANMGQATLKGRAAGAGTGDPTDLTPAQAKTLLAMTASDVSGLATIATSGSASDLSSGSIPAARVASGTITLAMQADMATASVVYRKTAGAGAPEVQTLATLKTDLGLTGTNSGDQTTIVGITGTKAQFDTAVTDGNFVYVGDVTQYTDELAQDAIGGMVDATLVYDDATPALKRAPITGDISVPDGSNTAAISAGVIVNADINASAGIDATKIADGSVSSTEFQYINTLSSNAQTQLDGKQPLDADLTTLASLTATTDNFIVSVAGAWASRTPAQVRTTLGLDYGTYTPTLTNIANLDSSIAFSCQYMRVGNTVTVSGRVDVDPTLTATLTQLGISLPIASNFANSNECAGTASAATVAAQAGAIIADPTNDRAWLFFFSNSTGGSGMFFTFTYRII